MAARRRTRASSHLIAELKARGLKVTLYPFVMMDVPAGNTLPDPLTGAARSRLIPGAAASPAIRRRASLARRTAPPRPATQIDAFFGDGDRLGATAAWCCTTPTSPRRRAASMRS